MSHQTLKDQRRCCVYVTAVDGASGHLNLVWEGSATSTADAIQQANELGRDYGFTELTITAIKVKPKQGAAA